MAFTVWFVFGWKKFDQKLTKDSIELWLLIARIRYSAALMDAVSAGNRALIDRIGRKIEQLQRIFDKKEFAKEQIEAFDILSKKLNRKKISNDQMIDEIVRLFASDPLN